MTFSYSVACRKEELKTLRDLFSDELTTNGISGLLRDQIVLAVDEACANAIIHGNDCDESRKIKLKATLAVDDNDRILTVQVFDVGEFEMNPKLLERDIQYFITNRLKGGLGLRLIHTIMDEVGFHNEDRVHICTMKKRIPGLHLAATQASEHSDSDSEAI
ncbi:MAG: serine/threonine-protein kinase RsbW [Limisphaerales bacterium]|jgi:serine/threonine-protein kinase RsbW